MGKSDPLNAGHPRRTRLLLAAGGVVFLVALAVFGWVETTRRDLLRYRAVLEHQGENLSGSAVSAESTAYPGPLLTALESLGDADRKIPSTEKLRFRPPDAAPGGKVAQSLLPALRSFGRKSDVTWEEVARSFDTTRTLLAELRAAAVQPGQTIPIGSGDAPNLRGANLALTATGWLAREALLFLHEQRTRAAVENISALLALAEKASQNDSLLAQMVAWSIVGQAFDPSWEILHAGASPNDLRLLAEAWNRADLRRTFPSSLRAERAVVLGALARDPSDLFVSERNMSRFWSSSSASHPLAELADDMSFSVRFLAWSALFRHRDERRTLEFYQTVLGHFASQSPGVTMLADTQSLVNTFETAGLPFACSRMTAGPIDGALEKLLLTETLTCLTRAAIALRRYAVDHGGAFPATLADLVPRYLDVVPLDPMDRAPLRYRPQGETYRLHAVGSDGVDDGGDPVPPAGKRLRDFLTGRDIVWPAIAAPAPASAPEAPGPLSEKSAPAREESKHGTAAP